MMDAVGIMPCIHDSKVQAIAYILHYAQRSWRNATRINIFWSTVYSMSDPCSHDFTQQSITTTEPEQRLEVLEEISQTLGQP